MNEIQSKPSLSSSFDELRNQVEKQKIKIEKLERENDQLRDEVSKHQAETIKLERCSVEMYRLKEVDHAAEIKRLVKRVNLNRRRSE